MPASERTPSEIARLGRSLYDRDICSQLEPTRRGEIVVINIDTGEFKVGPDHLALADNMRAAHPNASLFAIRIGFPALSRIGGRFIRPARSPDKSQTCSNRSSP